MELKRKINQLRILNDALEDGDLIRLKALLSMLETMNIVLWLDALDIVFDYKTRSISE